MELLKKRSTASLILAAVIVVTTILGVHFSLERQAGKIEDMFTDGVYLEKDDYVQPSISSHLDARMNAAVGLASTASKYPEVKAEEDALREARRELVDAETIGEKYSANSKLEKVWPLLADALSAQQLNETDAEAFEYYSSTLSGAQKAIENSSYNEKVAQYRDGILGAFPISVLRFVSFASEPEFFGMEG